MDNSLKRELLRVPTERSITQVMGELGAAISGSGPALGFGRITSSYVPDDVDVVVSTSGSTGIAKEVGISRNALRVSTQASLTYLEAKIGQRWSLLLPLTHIAGVNVLARSLELGTEPFDLRNTENFTNVDFTAIVPTQLYRALNGDGKLLKHLQSAQAVLVGGAALSHSLAHSAREVGINVVTTYGMSETSGGCVYNSKPLPKVDIRINPEGKVQIKGSMLAQTYLNDAQSWNDSFKEGWFTTNDLGTFDNGVLEIIGRSDEIIISGGEKVSLSAIEQSLSKKFPSVQLAACSIASPEWGSTLYIVGEDGSKLAESAIAEHLEEVFGPVAKPKGFFSIPALPLIGVGKVDRHALAHLVRDQGVNQ